MLVIYERLERYDHLTGVYKGSHVKLWDTVLGKESDAISYATAASLGMTQTDILTQIQIGAIAAADTANAALVAEQTAHASTTAQLNIALAKLQAAGIP